MEQKIVFREMLSEVKALADKNGNQLTTEEIDAFFAHAQLDRSQMELIYEYLVGQKIQVKGYEGSGTSSSETEAVWTEEAEEQPSRDRPASIEIYLEELNALEEIDSEEEFKLFQRAVKGEADAKSRLVQRYLTLVCDLAGEYDGSDLPVEDLIQEGNMGLLLAVDALEERDSLAAYQVQLMNEVSRYMQDTLQESKDLRELGDGIARRVNRLDEAIRSLEEELEHKVSVEELSAYLEMPAEEIRTILRMAGDELDVEDGSAIFPSSPGEEGI